MKTRLLIEIATGSALLVLGLILGGKVSTLSKYVLVMGGTALTSAVVAASLDTSGTLKLEIANLKGRLTQVQNKLDEEYRDKESLVSTTLNLQNRLSDIETELQIALSTVQDQESEIEQWKQAAHDGLIKTRALKDALDTQESRHKAQLADLDRSHRADVHKRVKEQVTTKSVRMYENYQRHTQETTGELNKMHSVELGRYQSRIDELSREVERLEGELLKITTEKNELSSLFNEVSRRDLPEVRATFEKEWQENDRQLQAAIDELQRRNSELMRPDMFPGESASSRRANRVIEYFWTQGQILDGRWIDRAEKEDIVWYQYRDLMRSPDFIDSLNDTTNLNWIQMNLGLLTPPKFVFDVDRFLLKLTLHHSRVRANEREVERLWRTKEEFLTIAGQWTRVRVTGGSESGKSPTGENIAYAILQAKPGMVKLGNPQHDSVKNFWSIQPCWKTHKECFEGMKQLADRVKARSEGLETERDFVLHIFDEMDSTLSAHKTASNYVLASIKQASHQNLGMIFIGQNANASEYPGMDRSDFENVVNVHIGSNAFHAIENSNMSKQWKDQSSITATKLLEFCEARNDELGLAKTDPKAYRFGMVIEPGKKPYFIELPYFGSYRLYDAMTTQTPTSDTETDSSERAVLAAREASNPDSDVAAKLPVSTYMGVQCPKCRVGSLSRTKSSRGVKYYVCDSCNKSTSESVLNSSFVIS